MTNRVFVHIHASEEVTAPAISLILGLGKAKIEIFSNYRNGRCIMALNLEPAYKEIFSKFSNAEKIRDTVRRK